MSPTIESSGSQTAILNTWHPLATPSTAKTRVLVVDLSALANGETVDLQIKSKARAADTESVAYQASYSHAQAEPLVYSVPVPVGTTATFSLRQTGGTGRDFPWAVYSLEPGEALDNRVAALEIQPINPQTGTTYTIVEGDQNKLVTLSNTGAITVTLPQDSSVTFPVGGRIDFLVINTGMATFSAGTGATVNATPSAVTRAQWSAATAIKRAANTWVVVGDLA